MNVLLTGAAGFIGSHVAKRLLRRGDNVIGIDNFNDYYAPQQKWANAIELKEYPNFCLLPSDISEITASQLTDASIDVVIHLAAMAGVRNSVINPGLYFDVNMTSSQKLIEHARQANVANFVFASTSSVYGHTRRIPFNEDDACSHPLHPYAASKRAVEQIGFAYQQNYRFNFTALRFFTVYGPSGRPDMMPFLVAKSIYDGTPVPLFAGNFHRDWTFVDDIADGIIRAADRPLGFEIINLGRGRPVSLNQFISRLEETAGTHANLIPTPAPPTEMALTFADNSKAEKLLDFKPSIGVEEGVDRFWAWFKQYHGRTSHESTTHQIVQEANLKVA